MKDEIASRRRFLSQTSAGLMAPSVAGRGAPAPMQPFSEVDETKMLKSLNIWDGHCHLSGFEGRTIEEKMAAMVRLAERMCVERMCVFLGFPIIGRPTPEQMRAQNDQVLQVVNRWRHRAFGYAFLNPNYPQACLDELNRCVRDGPMVGAKFEFDTPRNASSPELDPIIARAGELRAVIMYHTWIKTNGNETGESTPGQLAELARRHPSVTIFCGHTGGTWELGIRMIREVKNLYSELSGSDPTSGYTEAAIRELGPERVVYGSDVGGRSFASQLGKVMGANISDSARRQVLGGNLRRALQPILKAKGVRL